MSLSMWTDRRAKAPLVASALLAATLAGTAPALSQEVRGSVTAYGWLPSTDGSVGTGQGGLNSSSDGDDILDALKLAGMAAGDVQYGRFGMAGDLVYAAFGTDGVRAGGGTTSVDSSVLMVAGVATYRLYESDGLFLDALAGLRVLDVSADIVVTGGGPIGITLAASPGETLVDPVVGVRWRLPLTGSLSFIGFGTVGGFGVGTELTVDVFGGIDYAFADHWSAKAGVRYISLDISRSGTDIDLDLYGPAVGVTYRF